jgi:tetratricopeptide (TPR) repeat protein
MSFNHPEFIFWMSPLVGILFYFWLTQKRRNAHYFSPEALEKLRVDGSTLGEDGRNGLFLCASLLMIVALAQPVIKQERIIDPSETILIAIDVSKQSLDEFDTMKQTAIQLVDEIQGSVELVAYDSNVYRIAPQSDDKKRLKELISNLSPLLMNDSTSDEKMLRKVCTTSNIVIVSGSKSVNREMVENFSKPKEHWLYSSLFYFPLGMAMLCIAIALSSMSKRQGISIVFVVAMIFSGVNESRAGVMDFRLLEKANSAYSHGEYERSARLFNEYRLLHDTPQVRYNYANALFKAGHYEKAKYWYEQVKTSDPKLKEWVRINIGQLPSKKMEKLAKSEKKSERIVKKEKTKGQKIICIQNATPLFLY